MLKELRISNLAVVEDVTINFSSGLNVLTGSTGAGKSIILTAVELLSGKRAKRSLVRKGADKLIIEGIFEVDETSPVKRELGLKGNENAISIRRDFSLEGKGGIWINGAVSTSALAKRITDSLIELHGQHRQQELLDSSNHILYFDSWGDYDELLQECSELFYRYKEVHEKLQKLTKEYLENREKEDFLRFQLQELEALNLYPGIDKDLKARLGRLENMHKFVSTLEAVSDILSNADGSVVEKVNQAGKLLGSLKGIDDSWLEHLEYLTEVSEGLQNLATEIDRTLVDLTDEPIDVEDLQERLAGIQKACRKYKLDCDGLIEKKESLIRAISMIEDGSSEIEAAKAEVASIRNRIIPLFSQLTKRRKELSAKLDEMITREIRSIGIKGGLFKTKIESGDESIFEKDELPLVFTDRGWDNVEFLIRTNIGDDLRPLSEIVSGGELSRVTLILKKVFIERRGIPTLIFDEIDTGLGADLGDVVADKLASLARHYQVICITHLPQVASRANHHIKVEKKVVNNRTLTWAKVLEYNERVSELSRMLGGKGKLQEKLAEEMLANVKSARSSAG